MVPGNSRDTGLLTDFLKSGKSNAVLRLAFTPIFVYIWLASAGEWVFLPGGAFKEVEHA